MLRLLEELQSFISNLDIEADLLYTASDGIKITLGRWDYQLQLGWRDKESLTEVISILACILPCIPEMYWINIGNAQYKVLMSEGSPYSFFDKIKAKEEYGTLLQSAVSDLIDILWRYTDE